MIPFVSRSIARRYLIQKFYMKIFYNYYLRSHKDQYPDTIQTFPQTSFIKLESNYFRLTSSENKPCPSNPYANTSIIFSIIKRSDLIRDALPDKSWNNVLPKKRKRKPRGSSPLNRPYLATATTQRSEGSRKLWIARRSNWLSRERTFFHGFPSRLTQGTGKPARSTT